VTTESARKETVARIAMEKEEAEARAKAEAAARARLEELKPDREKINLVAAAVEAIVVPYLSPAAEVAQMAVGQLLSDCTREIRAIAKRLS